MLKTGPLELTEAQLAAMERNAPLLVSALRNARHERDKLGEACDVFKARLVELEAERDEARRERDYWKTHHDREVAESTLRLRSVEKLDAALERLRAVAAQARGALRRLLNQAEGMTTDDMVHRTSPPDDGRAALASLEAALGGGE